MPQVDDRPLTITGHILDTDRGGLWLASRGEGERSLLRLVERNLADFEFQAKVTQLREALAKQSVPRALPIVNDGFYGDSHSWIADFSASPDPDPFAGIVLGARVPIVLTSRADSPRARMASAAVAALYANARRRSAPIAAA
jgi:hypothetical protein